MTAAPERTAGLRAARAQDSADKRRRALATIHALEAAGTPITVSAVANAAAVSTWLVYADGVREHLDTARRRQAEHANTPASTAAPGDQAPVTPAGLRTDLALARDEDPPAARRTRQAPPPAPPATRRRDRPARPGRTDHPTRRARIAGPATARRTRRSTPPRPTTPNAASTNSKTT